MRKLEDLARDHECVAVGFSGGKDSLATLDLAVRFFKRVVPYFYYFVPGLKCEEDKIQIARDHYKLPILMYPSSEGVEALRTGVYCDEFPEFDDLPEISRRTLYNWIKADAGATLILTGEKMADGIFRRMRMGAQKVTMADVHYPLKEWVKAEVYNYLSARNLPIPNAGTGDNGGVSLMENEILWLYRHCPHNRECYYRLREFFPYIETEVKAAEWFGAPDPKAKGRAKSGKGGV